MGANQQHEVPIIGCENPRLARCRAIQFFGTAAHPFIAIPSAQATGTGCRSKSAARHSTRILMYRLLRRAHVALARRRSIRCRLCRCSPFLIRPGREPTAHAVVTTGCARSPQRRASPRHVMHSRLESRRLAVALRRSGDPLVAPACCRRVHHARGSGRLSRRHPGLPDPRRVSSRSTVVAALRSARADPVAAIPTGRTGRGFPRMACGKLLHRNQALPTTAGRSSPAGVTCRRARGS